MNGYQLFERFWAGLEGAVNIYGTAALKSGSTNWWHEQQNAPLRVLMYQKSFSFPCSFPLASNCDVTHSSWNWWKVLAPVPGQWWPHLRKFRYRVKIFFTVWTNDNAFIVNSSYGFCRIIHYCRTHLWQCFTSWNITIIRRMVMSFSLFKKSNTEMNFILCNNIQAEYIFANTLYASLHEPLHRGRGILRL